MNKTRYAFALMASLLLPTCLASCQAEIDASTTIYASYYSLTYFVKQVVGDAYEVENITPNGSEPHDYSPTARQVAELYDCKAIFVNGLGLENYVSSFPSGLFEKTYEVNDGVETLSISGTVDPHVWLDPKNAIIEMNNIKDKMIEIDPDNEGIYEENYETAKAKMETLDEELTSLAEETINKYIVTSHAAFSYLCDAYGFTQIYLSGLSPDEEPSARDIEAIIEAMNEYGVTTVFYEENVSSEIASKIAAQTGAKTKELNPLESLSDEMIANGDDYISVMKENLLAIKEAGNSI